jgi:hypothetical protein
LAAAIAAAADVDEVADAVHDLAGTALSASACGIALRTSDGVLTFAGRVAADGTGRWASIAPSVDMPLTAVLATGQPLCLIGPETMIDRWPQTQQLQQQTGDQSWAILPLTDTTSVIGVLAFAFARRRSFWPDDRQYLASIAGLTSQALQRAYAHRRDHSIARTLQQALLPTALPDLPGLRAACRYRAADNSADVGGDFYDLFYDDDGTVTATIGDVCRGGLAAAAMVGQARHSLRALATMHEPRTALQALKRAAARAPRRPLPHRRHCATHRATAVRRWVAGRASARWTRVR